MIKKQTTVDMSIGLTLPDLYSQFQSLDNKQDRVDFLQKFRDYNLPFLINWDALIELWQNFEEPTDVLVAEEYDPSEETETETEIVEELK